MKSSPHAALLGGVSFARPPPAGGPSRSGGLFAAQLSRLDGALLELSGGRCGPFEREAAAARAEALMLADHRRLLTELRACRDSLNEGAARSALTRLLSRHEQLAAQLRVFSHTA